MKLPFCFVFFFLNVMAVSAQPINVAVAANLLFPMQKIEALYEAQSKEKVNLISASSGVLTAQISNGAPYQLFISADMKYPQILYRDGKTLSKPQVLVNGQLVYWSKKNVTKDQLLQSLKNDAIKSIAIAQPSLAPYGQAAKKWLQRNNVFASIEGKLVYGENVGQVNRYIYSGSVDAAFTAVSAMFASELKNKGHWLLLENEVEDAALLAHGWAILKAATEERDKVKKFVEFLATPPAKAVFQEFGYIVP